MAETAYLDGHFVPLSQARVSVEDRGFVFADSVYEVIVTYNGRPFQLEDHLVRLAASAQAIHLRLPLSASEIQKIVEEGVDRSGFGDTKIYLQVTRGIAPRSHPFPADAKANFVATFRAKVELPGDLRSKGVSIITTEDLRWAKCHIKSTALLPNVLASQMAMEATAFEAVFVTPSGVVHEGSASNIFIVQKGLVRTPAKTERILHGITRETVLQCARDSGYGVAEDKVKVENLRAAEEVFLTGTTIEVLGAVKVDAGVVGSGAVGPATTRIHESFRALTRS